MQPFLLNTMRQETIYQNNRELFDCAHQIDDFGRTMLEEFNKRELKLFDLPSYQRIFLFIITRSIKTYSSIVLLCEQGYGQDVSPLLRSLLENLITVKYMLHNQSRADELAKRFVAYKWVIFKRTLPEQEKQLEWAAPEEKKEFIRRRHMILEQVEDFKKTFRITSDRALVTWSGKTVRDMARQVGQKWLEHYDTTFRLCSRFSHPSILGDKEYIIQDEKHLIFSPLPSTIGIVPNLQNSMTYILEFFRIIDELFDFGYRNQLQDLDLKSQKLFQQSANPPITEPDRKSDQKIPIRESIIVFKTKSS